MRKLVLFDIDNTLIDESIYPSNFELLKNKIKSLQRKNYFFGICSCRPFDINVKKIYNKYGLCGPIISEGGNCLSRKHFGIFVTKPFTKLNINVNKFVRRKILEYENSNNLTIPVKIMDIDTKTNVIQLNKFRKLSATIRFPSSMKEHIGKIVEILKDCPELTNMTINQCSYNKRKVNVYPSNVDKFTAIEKFFPNENVILVTDGEPTLPPENRKSCLVFSVGTDETFNSKCDMVFPTFGKGVEEILKFLENKEKTMKNYEVLSENCKMYWEEGFNHTNEKYTQVSGYIFNDKDQLLIVRNDKTWTIPGGHPEAGETKLQTLDREIMEEACCTLQDVKYLGAVEVVENGETYYQLRYTARVKEALPFKQEWEIAERKFVDLDDLPNYIKWAKGVTFAAQIDSARKVWKI